MTSTDRRQFLTTAAAVAAVTPFAGAIGAGREDILNLALVGCGGRGKGSIGDTMAVNEGMNTFMKPPMESNSDSLAKTPPNPSAAEYAQTRSITPEATKTGAA